ncbi:MAG: TraR/DksA family transcriptional regulator [Ferrovibrio sp.]|uniref:TraR/DksA family transcriptional regulator n=1 Tax=Ferrovibrio sp. TaxID=1917215 RepID=UPI00391DBD4B
MNLSGFEQRLREERAQLQNLRDISDAGRKPVELDQASVGRLSRMDAMQMQAMAAASERRRQMRITAIDAALARLAEGEFGYCVSCGEEIGTRRLELDPAAASCISCAAKV